MCGVIYLPNGDEVSTIADAYEIGADFDHTDTAWITDWAPDGDCCLCPVDVLDALDRGGITYRFDPVFGDVYLPGSPGYDDLPEVVR
ncbi:MAG TPA: hypothetical protein PKB00_04505 [Microthrixaceae bacterium]|nr:hypothetical protein [Microthrixaceae bacterium]